VTTTARWGAALALGLGLSAALAGCGRAATPAAAPAAGWVLPPGARVATARTAQRAATYAAVGTVEARTSAQPAAQAGGTVTRVNVNVGARVRAGEVLVELALPEADQGLAAARADVAAADAALAAARQQAAATEAQARLAQATYARFQALRRENSVSPHEFDQAQAAARAAAAQAAGARATVQGAAERAAAARARQQQARIQAGYSAVRAPFAGVVTAKFVQRGDLATPGEPLLALDAAGGWQLAVAVPEGLLGRLRLGEAALVRVDALGAQTLAGRIREIAPSSDPATRAAVVKLALPDAAGLRGGLYGEATLPLAGETAEAALRVPAAAVLRHGELEEMYVLNPAGRAELRLVTLGATGGGEVEVLSGLSAGERFVLNPRILSGDAHASR
jgi:RND family efflux transporter MFP subunit